MTTDRTGRGGTLSARLWDTIEDVFAAILDHPFLHGLTDGTLPEEAFRFYVVQDAHYLRDYARALSGCSALAEGEDAIAMFASHAAEAIAVERELHAGFLEEWGIDERTLRDTPVAPTCLAYTSYLLASTARGSYAEAVGAVLPCYWIYAEVGRALLEQGSPNPLYRRWIDTYGGEEFAAVVQRVLAEVDRLGAVVGPAEESRMAARFRQTSRYEWMFWDMGHRMESWPV